MNIEMIDVMAHYGFNNALDLQRMVKELGNTFDRISLDGTQTEDGKILKKAKAWEKLKPKFDERLQGLGNEIAKVSSEWDASRFSNTYKLTPADVQLLPYHLTEYRNSKANLNNPKQAAALTELARQGLIEDKVIGSIDSIHTPEAMKSYARTQDQLQKVPDIGRVIAHYVESNIPKDRIDQIKSRLYEG